TLVGTDDVLPLPSARPKAVIATGDDFGPILQDDPERLLFRLPVGEHLRWFVVAVGRAPLRPPHPIPHPQGGARPVSLIRHQYGRLSPYAVRTCMRAAPEGVDRPVERQVVARDLVERRLGADLVEVDAERLRRVEAAHPLDLETRQTPALLLFHSL